MGKADESRFYTPRCRAPRIKSEAYQRLHQRKVGNRKDFGRDGRVGGWWCWITISPSDPSEGGVEAGGGGAAGAATTTCFRKVKTDGPGYQMPGAD